MVGGAGLSGGTGAVDAWGAMDPMSLTVAPSRSHVLTPGPQRAVGSRQQGGSVGSNPSGSDVVNVVGCRTLTSADLMTPVPQRSFNDDDDDDGDMGDGDSDLPAVQWPWDAPVPSFGFGGVGSGDFAAVDMDGMPLLLAGSGSDDDVS